MQQTGNKSALKEIWKPGNTQHSAWCQNRGWQRSFGERSFVFWHERWTDVSQYNSIFRAQTKKRFYTACCLSVLRLKCFPCLHFFCQPFIAEAVMVTSTPHKTRILHRRQHRDRHKPLGELLLAASPLYPQISTCTKGRKKSQLFYDYQHAEGLVMTWFSKRHYKTYADAWFTLFRKGGEDSRESMDMNQPVIGGAYLKKSKRTYMYTWKCDARLCQIFYFSSTTFGQPCIASAWNSHCSNY